MCGVYLVGAGLVDFYVGIKKEWPVGLALGPRPAIISSHIHIQKYKMRKNQSRIVLSADIMVACNLRPATIPPQPATERLIDQRNI